MSSPWGHGDPVDGPRVGAPSQIAIPGYVSRVQSQQQRSGAVRAPPLAPWPESSPRFALAALLVGWLSALVLDFLPAGIPQSLQPLEWGARDSQIWLWVLPLAPLAWMLRVRSPATSPRPPVRTFTPGDRFWAAASL